MNDFKQAQYALGYTNKQMAEILDVSLATIARYRRGGNVPALVMRYLSLQVSAQIDKEHHQNANQS